MAIKFSNLPPPKGATNVLAARLQTMLQQAMALHQNGQLAQAQGMYQEILRIQPSHFHALHLLGVMAFQVRNCPKALELIDRAIAIKPDFAEAYCNRGLALKEMNQLAAAVASFDRAIAIKPDFTDAYSNRGLALRELGQFGAAVASFDKAIAIKPDFAEAHSNRGRALQGLSQLDAALASLDKAIAIKPDLAEAHSNRGVALQGLKQLGAALASYDRAIALKPDFSEAYFNRGNALQELRQYVDAVASYDKAIAIKPNYADAYSDRGNALKELKQLDAAVASYDKAIAIKPDLAEAHYNRGLALQDLQQLDAAVVSYDNALAVNPGLVTAYGSRLFCLSHSHGVDSRQLHSEHLAFGQRFEAPLRDSWQPHSNSKDPARRLQVGFVSGDLYYHAVASFLEPVLEFLAKKPGLSIHAYDTHTVDDEVSRRLRTYFANWHTVAGLSDAELANKIRADGIDILIDLSGHTGHNRLLTFARKPAPIQATWIGYPGTTGLQAMDYLLCDPFFVPQELAWQLTEKPAYLPTTIVFQPSELSPPVNPLPALKNGYITFGSFNRASKITAAVVALWSSLLRSVPTARMAVGAVAPDVKEALSQLFANEGIAPDRLTFFPHSNTRDYLALHYQIDICLDTFPYSGGTTTLHAAWMAVPTLTLTGETLPSRAGATLMNQLRLDEFIADSHEAFLSKGCYWAEHIEQLAALRLDMRARFQASAMGQPAPFADSLEAVLRTIWQRWCDDLPPATIERTNFD